MLVLVFIVNDLNKDNKTDFQTLDLYSEIPPTIEEKKMAHNQLNNWQNGDFHAILLVTLVGLVDAYLIYKYMIIITVHVKFPFASTESYSPFKI